MTTRRPRRRVRRLRLLMWGAGLLALGLCLWVVVTAGGPFASLPAVAATLVAAHLAVLSAAPFFHRDGIDFWLCAAEDAAAVAGVDGASGASLTD
ncbi:hypothetical protein [Streptomyces spiramenti]|uniref:Uncharacterized protein n=1 Tax=Streptomyces spiramenti TaxID=2720606 RepID=A0ABX1AJ03_9ACTN|nr:hypothetical protein [Streptomyces spiramenti]NJP65824.1 hypothetical protein [Streptomyces spiramenti]